MGINFVCEKCGTRWAQPSPLGNFRGHAVVEVTDNIAICPVEGCCGWGHSINGYYDFVGGVLNTFTAPGMTREKVEAVRGIAKEASSGQITTEDALQRLEAISEALAKAVAQPQGRKVNWEFLLALFALIWAIWTDRESDADAQAALAESRTQTEVAQKMLEESQAQTESLRELTTKPASRLQAPAQTTTQKNRAERRKAAAIERRSKNGVE